MRIKLDYPKLMRISDEKGIHSLAELCRQCGVSYNYVRSAICKRGTVNAETYYIFAKFLGCHVEDIQTAKQESKKLLP